MAVDTVEHLGALLVSLGLGRLAPTANADIFYNQMPSTPSGVTLLRTYGGAEGDRTLGRQGLTTEFPRIQILRRDVRAQDAFSRLYEIYRALQKVLNQTLSGVAYVRIEPQQPPFFLMNDDATNNPIYAFNVEVEKAMTP